MRLLPPGVCTPQFAGHALEVPYQGFINAGGKPWVVDIGVFGSEVAVGQVNPDGVGDDLDGCGVDYAKEVYRSVA